MLDQLPQASPKLILIVEDDPLNAKVLDLAITQETP